MNAVKGGKNMIPVKLVMKREVLTTNINTPVRKASERMHDRKVGSLMVKDGKETIGILTESDIVQKVVAVGRNPETTMVEDVMSKPLITIDSQESVLDADELMEQEHIRHLAVTEHGKVVGIVSVRDLLFPLQYALVSSNSGVEEIQAAATAHPGRGERAPLGKQPGKKSKAKESGPEGSSHLSLAKVRADQLMERDVPYYHSDAIGLTLATAMINRRCGAIPIVDEQKQLIGIVTEFDLLNALLKGNNLEDIRAVDIMASEAKFVKQETLADEIIQIMDSLHLIHIPVVDRQGRLLGLIERSDILLGYLESRQGTMHP